MVLSYLIKSLRDDVIIKKSISAMFKQFKNGKVLPYVANFQIKCFSFHVYASMKLINKALQMHIFFVDETCYLMTHLMSYKKCL